MSLPILYSLRRCPYAMRARMGILLAKQLVMLRDIVLKNIPPQMRQVSSKATVPVLVIDPELVLDESLDIMLWALTKSDPRDLLHHEQPTALANMLSLIALHDQEFIHWLEKYKFAARHYDISEVYYRRQSEVFVQTIEQRLNENYFLFGATPSLADYAILPFIRQFARVDRKWFLQSPYPHVRRWLTKHFQDPMFTKVMTKFPHFMENQQSFLFGDQ